MARVRDTDAFAAGRWYGLPHLWKLVKASAMMDWFRKFLGAPPAEASAVLPVPGSAPVPAPGSVPAAAFDLDDPRLPAPARASAKAIMAAIEAVLNNSHNSEFDRIVLGELVQMRAEHLPKLLRSYVDVPPQHRKEIFKNTGRSASFLLDDALRKMAGRVDKLSRDLAQNDLDAFANNAEFVSRRYGAIDDPFA